MPHRKKCPHMVHFNVHVPQDWSETNSRHQKRYSEGGKKNFGCQGLLGRVIHHSHISSLTWYHKKKLTADMASDWLIADMGTVISDTKWLYNIYSLTIVQKRPTHTWGYQDPIPYNSQIFTLCCSRKYPYPSHGRFFNLNPQPLPLWKFHFSVIL